MSPTPLGRHVKMDMTIISLTVTSLVWANLQRKSQGKGERDEEQKRNGEAAGAGDEADNS
eukprot:scaffold101224_cov19-Prasinocladus_malaysianus.AAC.1